MIDTISYLYTGLCVITGFACLLTIIYAARPSSTRHTMRRLERMALAIEHQASELPIESRASCLQLHDLVLLAACLAPFISAGLVKERCATDHQIDFQFVADPDQRRHLDPVLGYASGAWRNYWLLVALGHPLRIKHWPEYCRSLCYLLFNKGISGAARHFDADQSVDNLTRLAALLPNEQMFRSDRSNEKAPIAF